MKQTLLISIAIVALWVISCDDVPLSAIRIGPDTTSHNFVWRVDTLGDIYSSVLYDVFIIDDNNIWAVGEINIKNANGNWINPPYNIARWNGQQWTLDRVLFKWDFGTGYSQARAIFAFSPTDILVSSGGSVMRWNGTNWSNLGFLCEGTNCVGSVYRIWGVNNKDLYGVGYGGKIVHWNGSAWNLESQVDCDLTDIWGGGSIVWTCGWKFDNSESVLLKKTNALWNTLWKKTQPDFSVPYIGLLSSVWANAEQAWIVGSAGAFEHFPQDPDYIEKTKLLLTNFPYRVRGSANNDVTLAGDASMIWHWNGSTWHKYDELYNQDNRLYGLHATASRVVAVGRRYDPLSAPALIISGSR